MNKISPESQLGSGNILGRSLIVGAAYGLASTVVAGLLGPMSRLTPTPDNAAIWTLTGTLVCLSLSPFILNSNWSRRNTTLAVWAVLAFVRSSGLGIEGSLFKPTQAWSAIVGAFFGILIGLLVAWLAVILLMPAGKPGMKISSPNKSWWGWTWRVLIVGLAYFVFYFVFGATNGVLYTLSFYKNNPQYGLKLPPAATIFLAQLIRGPLFGLGSLFVVRMVNLPRRQIAISLGILLFIVGGLSANPLVSLGVQANSKLKSRRHLTGLPCLYLGPYLEVTFRTMPLGFNLATLTELDFIHWILERRCA